MEKNNGSSLTGTNYNEDYRKGVQITEKNWNFGNIYKFKGSIREIRKRILMSQVDIFMQVFKPNACVMQNQQQLRLALKILEKIQEANCKCLGARSINLHYHIGMILSPKFSKLIVLSMNQCQITSMESIAFLDAPLLQILQISRNKICFGKPAQKLKFDYLTQLNLDNNFIQQSSYASRIFFTTLNDSILGEINNETQRQKIPLWYAEFNRWSKNKYQFNTKMRLDAFLNYPNGEKFISKSLAIQDIGFFSKIQYHYEKFRKLFTNKKENQLILLENDTNIKIPKNEEKESGQKQQSNGNSNQKQKKMPGQQKRESTEQTLPEVNVKPLNLLRPIESYNLFDMTQKVNEFLADTIFEYKMSQLNRHFHQNQQRETYDKNNEINRELLNKIRMNVIKRLNICYSLLEKIQFT